MKSLGIELECPNFHFEDSPENQLIENVTMSASIKQQKIIPTLKGTLELC